MLLALVCYGLYLAETEAHFLSDLFIQFSETDFVKKLQELLPADLSSQTSVRPASEANTASDDLQPIDGQGELTQDPQNLPEPENTGSSYDFSPVFYPYREMLSENGKTLYNQIYANIIELNEEFSLAVPAKVEELDMIVSAVLFDHAELFWVDYRYEYSYLNDGSVVSLRLFFNQTADNFQTYQKRFDQAANAVIQQASLISTTLEKEKFVHDYLLDHVEYDLDSDLNQSAYSALVGDASVCAGYARAFQYLMTQLGIPCYYCVGDANGNHAWNIIALEDGYYHVDVSWDDPIGNPSGSYYYQYFNLTDREIASSHTRSNLSVWLPACNGPALSSVPDSEQATQPSVSGQDMDSLPTYQQAGFGEDSLLSSLEEYYDACYQMLLEYGTGDYTLHFLIADQDLLDQIYEAMDTKAYVAGYLEDALRKIGISGYSAQLYLSAEPLADGYYHLSQQMSIQEKQKDTGQPEDGMLEPVMKRRPAADPAA